MRAARSSTGRSASWADTSALLRYSSFALSWHVRVRSFCLFIPFAPTSDDKTSSNSYLVFSELNHIDHGGLVLVDGVLQSALCK